MPRPHVGAISKFLNVSAVLRFYVVMIFVFENQFCFTVAKVIQFLI